MDISINKEPPRSSGGDNNYYVIKIQHSKRFDPCTVECEDVIRALNLDFFEGEAFKSIWRKAADRLGNGKPGDSALRNAEKVKHYGSSMVDHEIYLADKNRAIPVQMELFPDKEPTHFDEYVSGIRARKAYGDSAEHFSMPGVDIE